MAEETKTEKRELRAHPKMIYDVITRQAGTIAKAILEGVMNAVDAKATKLDINITEDAVRLTDDGSGFGSAENIKNFFEVFGYPHDEREQKTYGAFRMGRGQMFAFGKNTWHTGTWKMEVDIRTLGLSYSLETIDKHTPGCDIHIALYKPLSEYEQGYTLDNLREWCKWVPIVVNVNGERISKKVDEETWDYEVEGAKIQLDPTSRLRVYNLGVFVCDYGASHFGTGGTIVTSEQLKVNFARNDIQHDCPVWNRIKTKLEAVVVKDISNKQKKMTDAERQKIVDLIRTRQYKVMHETGIDPKTVPVIKLITGRYVSWKDLQHSVRYRYSGLRVCVAPDKSRVGDTLMRRRIAVVISDATLKMFKQSSIAAVISFLDPEVKRASDLPFDLADFEQISKESNASYTIVKAENAREKFWLDIATTLQSKLSQLLKYDDELKHRVTSLRRGVCLGVSDAASGWTDGRSYIALERKFVSSLSFDMDGVYRLLQLLIHEMCHTDPDSRDHDHDQPFFERCHDVNRMAGVGPLLLDCISRFKATAKRHDYKLPYAALRAIDKTNATVQDAGVNEQPAGSVPPPSDEPVAEVPVEMPVEMPVAASPVVASVSPVVTEKEMPPETAGPPDPDNDPFDLRSLGL